MAGFSQGGWRLSCAFHLLGEREKKTNRRICSVLSQFVNLSIFVTLSLQWFVLFLQIYYYNCACRSAFYSPNLITM
ncbi:hypothetical protein FGO68_gene1685 [Halteria grandinella]|uniref:Uncharacterized protein n=1 Tax=Halteria grandinella TaxID=5974 RepID=A0A8J8NIH4_HALGN|nr:hypothetical protein FGO68_gene1685 [Halteria grandinella]